MFICLTRLPKNEYKKKIKKRPGTKLIFFFLSEQFARRNIYELDDCHQELLNGQIQ